MSTKTAAEKTAGASNGNKQTTLNSNGKSNADAPAKPAAKRASKTTVKKATPPSSKPAAKVRAITPDVDVQQLRQELASAKEFVNQQDQQKQALEKQVKELEIKLSIDKPTSIIDAMIKVQTTKTVAEKLEYLKETKKELSGFALGTAGVQETLTVTDGSGKSFASHNSGTVKLVIDTLMVELDSKIDKAEKQLLDVI